MLAMWRRGDASAGQALVKIHYKAIFSFLRKRLDEPNAADLTQATFETLCQKRDDFRGDAAMRTYIFAIARFKLTNHCRQRRRQAQRQDPIDDDLLIGDDHSLTSLLESRRAQTLVIRAMDALDLDDQIILELKIYEGLTTAALAEVFGATSGAISGRVSRARGRLRAAMEALDSEQGLAELTMRSLAGRMEDIQTAAAQQAKHSPQSST